MLNIINASYLSIYTAERKETEEENPLDFWYHSFLLLVDLSHEKPIIIQQLHYNDGADLSFAPNLRVGVGDTTRFQDVKASLVMDGDALDILERWNYMCGYALYLRHSEAKFDLEYKHSEIASNCRSAVISSLRSIGVDYNPSYYASEAGTKSEALPIGSSFTRAASNTKTLAELLKRNEVFTDVLKPDWIAQDRYIGTLPFPLKSML